jgi:2-desacetyl-2-hydroxyethyl bacteriochlorophyllide A dehydrogenase
MKAAVWLGKEKLVVREVEKPSPGSGEALIKVRWAGICGTDLAVYAGKFPRARPPLIPGHEFSGEIVQVPRENPSGLKEGDAVVVEPLLPCGTCYSCRMGMYNVCENFAIMGVDASGSFAEFVKARAGSIYLLPPGLSLELAALTEPMAVALRTVQRSGMRVGDSVVILGGGPIGLLVAELGRMGGAMPIIISEVSPYRANLASKLGFKVVIPNKDDLEKRVRDLTRGRGADVVFDAVGVPAAASEFTRISRVGGLIAVVGIYKEQAPVDLREVCFGELTITGSRVYRYPDFEKVMDLILKDSDRLSSIVTEKMELDQIGKGMKLLNEGRAMKVLIHPFS